MGCTGVRTKLSKAHFVFFDKLRVIVRCMFYHTLRPKCRGKQEQADDKSMEYRTDNAQIREG